MARFDEMELDAATFRVNVPAAPRSEGEIAHAPRFQRLLALLTDLSLFVALALALSPLLPVSMSWPSSAALAGFIILVSYYYFVGTWLLWGKTIGGTIFDVRVVASSGDAMAFKSATKRWLGIYFSLVTGGVGFALAVFPSRRSLADRLSRTHCITAS
jgi:uncharacterized RDD family membrane protein YckC